MVEFFIYWDGVGSQMQRRPKIALRFDGQVHSLDAVAVAVPTYSVTCPSGPTPRFQMSGLANSIDIAEGKATIK